MIDGHLNDFGRDIADRLERSCDVKPIETENDVGAPNGIGCFRRQHCAARGTGMQTMVGRERGCDLQVGHDERVEPLGECNPRFPGVDITRCAAGENDRMFGAL